MYWFIIGALLLFYPFTFCLIAQNGKLLLYWQPFCSGFFFRYGIKLPLKKFPALSGKKLSAAGLRNKLRIVGIVLTAADLRQLYFYAALGSFWQGKCIISWRLWNIMVKTLRHLSRKTGRP